jgi:hypothetical protein
VKWVEVAQEVAVGALAVAAGVGRAAWAVPRLPVPAVTASAPTAGTGCRISLVNLVTTRSALSAARR